MAHLMNHEAIGCGINRVHKSTMQLASFYFHKLCLSGLIILIYRSYGVQEAS